MGRQPELEKPNTTWIHSHSNWIDFSLEQTRRDSRKNMSLQVQLYQRLSLGLCFAGALNKPHVPALRQQTRTQGWPRHAAIHAAFSILLSAQTRPWSCTEPRAGEYRSGSRSLDPEGWVTAGRLAVWSYQKLPLTKMGIFPVGLCTTLRNISVQKQGHSPHYTLSAFTWRYHVEISKGNQYCYGKSLIQDHIPAVKQQEQLPPLSDFPPECKMEQRAETAHESQNHRIVWAARDL